MTLLNGQRTLNDPTGAKGTYVAKALSAFGTGDATARSPFNSAQVLDAAAAGTSDKVAHVLGTIITGDYSTSTGSNPTFGFGLNVFTITGTAAGDGNGATISNLVEADVQAPSGIISHVTGLQAEASFYGATAGATVTQLESMRVASPKRKDGATAGTVTNAYGLFIESFDGTAVGASQAFALFVEGGPSRLQGTLTVDNNINSYSGTLDLRPNTSNAQPYFQMTDIASGGNVTLVLGAAGSAFNVFNESIGLQFQVGHNGVGFNGASAVAKQIVSGSRGGNAAIASLLSALATVGLITDSTSA